jgi:hypothetical protein
MLRVKEIIAFSKNLKNGDLAEFSRGRWGKGEKQLMKNSKKEKKKKEERILTDILKTIRRC